MKINIIVNTTFTAVHCWSSIPNEPSEQYLKYPHRHIFHVCLKKPVIHTDRDIEFIELKNELDTWISTTFRKTINERSSTIDLGKLSCEDLALMILHQFQGCYCRVMEDFENGAEVIRGNDNE